MGEAAAAASEEAKGDVERGDASAEVVPVRQGLQITPHMRSPAALVAGRPPVASSPSGTPSLSPWNPPTLASQNSASAACLSTLGRVPPPPTPTELLPHSSLHYPVSRDDTQRRSLVRSATSKSCRSSANGCSTVATMVPSGSAGVLPGHKVAPARAEQREAPCQQQRQQRQAPRMRSHEWLVPSPSLSSGSRRTAPSRPTHEPPTCASATQTKCVPRCGHSAQPSGRTVRLQVTRAACLGWHLLFSSPPLSFSSPASWAGRIERRRQRGRQRGMR